MENVTEFEGETQYFEGFKMENTTKHQEKLATALKPDRMIAGPDGKLRPVGFYRDRDVLVHDWVDERVQAALERKARLEKEKTTDFEEFDILQDLVLEAFNARITGTRGGGEFTSLDGLMKVQVTLADHRYVGPEIVAAQAKINEIMDDLMADIDPSLRQLIDKAFVRNEQTGKISTARIVPLLGLNLAHPLWPEAQAALRAAIRIGDFKRYMRFYRRANVNAPWELIDLNYSSILA